MANCVRRRQQLAIVPAPLCPPATVAPPCSAHQARRRRCTSSRPRSRDAPAARRHRVAQRLDDPASGTPPAAVTGGRVPASPVSGALPRHPSLSTVDRHGRPPRRPTAHPPDVEAQELVRTARRHAGLSQRALARVAGVDATTVAAVEAGRRIPGVTVLAAIVRAAGLELTVDRPVVPLCRHVRSHLRRSLSARLHLLVGGSGRPRVPPVPSLWAELDRAAAGGRVYLTGPSAVGLWVPGVDAPAPSFVITARRPPGPGAAAHRRPGPGAARRRELSRAFSTGPVPADCTVTVPLPGHSVRTPPPEALALRSDCAPWRTVLRSVARALDEQGALDRAGRRSPAHREPLREDEAGRLLVARRWNASLRPPDRLNGRGWRLDDEVGFQEWVERRALRR